MKVIGLIWDYFFFIVLALLLISIVSTSFCGAYSWWDNLNRQFEEQPIEVHDRLATPEELEYYKQLEIERKRQEEIKANPPRAVIDTSKGLQFSQGVNYFKGLKETWYGRSAGELVGTENFQSVDDWFLDADNYFVIACSNDICPRGGVIETSKGLAKRYDTCPTPGVIDFYANK